MKRFIMLMLLWGITVSVQAGSTQLLSIQLSSCSYPNNDLTCVGGTLMWTDVSDANMNVYYGGGTGCILGSFARITQNGRSGDWSGADWYPGSGRFNSGGKKCNKYNASDLSSGLFQSQSFYLVSTPSGFSLGEPYEICLQLRGYNASRDDSFFNHYSTTDLITSSCTSGIIVGTPACDVILPSEINHGTVAVGDISSHTAMGVGSIQCIADTVGQISIVYSDPSLSSNKLNNVVGGNYITSRTEFSVDGGAYYSTLTRTLKPGATTITFRDTILNTTAIAGEYTGSIVLLFNNY